MGGNVEIGAQLWVYCYTQALAMDGRPFRLAAERKSPTVASKRHRALLRLCLMQSGLEEATCRGQQWPVSIKL